jgi:hypothetical protein
MATYDDDTNGTTADDNAALVRIHPERGGTEHVTGDVVGEEPYRPRKGNPSNLIHGAVPEEYRHMTDKQIRFVEMYCGPAHFNAKVAAKMAGYRDSNTGGDTRRIPDVAALIDATLDVMALTRAEILAELTRVALSPMEHFGQLVRPAFVDKDGVQYDAIVKLDYSAKMKALELIGKARAMFTDKVNLSGELGVTVREYREGTPIERAPNDEKGGGL